MRGLLKRQNGFTLLELVTVTVLVALMLSVALPVSYDMFSRYKAALRAQEVMLYVSGLHQESFLYSEEHLLDSRNSTLMVNGKDISFDGVLISVEEPIFFYRNGATSNGVIRIVSGSERYLLNVTAPFGALKLEPEEESG